MPLVQIEILEGQPPEVLRALHNGVARLIPDVIDAAPATVRTRITEIAVDKWGAGGVPESITHMLPLVRIDILEGRPLAARRALHDRVARLVADVLGVSLEAVRTYITEIAVEGWGIGGVPASIARRDVIEARRAAAG